VVDNGQRSKKKIRVLILGEPEIAFEYIMDGLGTSGLHQARLRETEQGLFQYSVLCNICFLMFNNLMLDSKFAQRIE
jgi:hypothetical protein